MSNEKYRILLPSNPVVYIYLYRKIKEISYNKRTVRQCQVLEILRRNLMHLPRCLHPIIIREMELMHLLKKMNKTKYELTGGKIDNFLNSFPF